MDVIRRLQSTDMAAIRPLLRQLDYDIDVAEITARVNHVLARQDHYVAVVERQGSIVGLVHVYERAALEKPVEAVVQALIVEEAARGSGLGSKLMQNAECWARERGLTSVSLHTQIARDDAIAFYRRLGYETVATAHLMRRTL